jgi:5-formaminoimidazole-4-carboxamide-1-beta-D-ribofuranosyl 5'-monophosphate synthetase
MNQMGLITELAEAIDVYKKKIAYKKDIDYVNLQEELIGDVFWYAVNYCRINELALPKMPEVLLDSQKPSYTDDEYVNHLIEFVKLSIKPKKNIASLMIKIYILSTYLNFDFYQSLTNNINKLMVRYPEKFDTDKAINRDLETERKRLEDK